MSNTKIEYLYRDASNYKIWNEAIVSGLLTSQQKEEILATLHEGLYFKPRKVGLPETRFSEDSNDDHDWLELEADGITSTDAAPTQRMTAAELLENFRAVSGDWEKEVKDSSKEYIVYRTPDGGIMLDWNDTVWKYGYPYYPKSRCTELERGICLGGMNLPVMYAAMKRKYGVTE